MNIDKYLYEIIDDYKYASSKEEKNDIFKSFCSFIWSSANKRRTYNKTITFEVRCDLLNTEVGQVFNTWSSIEYKGYKSMTKDTDWCSLIRQKINNLYTRYCDEEVILKKDYLNSLKMPKILYYKWIDGETYEPDKLTLLIDESFDTAEKLKSAYQKQKMKLSWGEYKKNIEDFLHKIFDNCKLIEDYEDKTKLTTLYDFVNEDNFYVKYFCQSLENYMQNFNKEYYGLKRGRNKQYKRCELCGKLIEKTNNRLQYCTDCKRKKELERYKKYNQKRNNHN